MTKHILLICLSWACFSVAAAPRPDPRYLENASQNLAQAFREDRPTTMRQSLLILRAADPDNAELETLFEAQEGLTDNLYALQARQQRTPNSALIAQALGLYHWQHARWTLACAAFERAHRLADEHPDPLFSLALCQIQEQNYAAALNKLQQARAQLANAVTRLTPSQLDQLETELKQLTKP